MITAVQLASWLNNHGYKLDVQETCDGPVAVILADDGRLDMILRNDAILRAFAHHRRNLVALIQEHTPCATTLVDRMEGKSREECETILREANLATFITMPTGGRARRTEPAPKATVRALFDALEEILDEHEGCDELHCGHAYCRAIDAVERAANRLGIRLGVDRC